MRALRWFVLFALFFMLMPVPAQERSPDAIVRFRVKEVRDSGDIRLDLRGLGLSVLPDDIWSLTQLKSLILSNNQLTRVPPEIDHLTALQELWLDGNQLTELPPEIGNLSNLRVLSLSNNALTHLPHEIGGATGLKRIDLHNNSLTELPQDVAYLPKLYWLSLDDNPLIFPPPDVHAHGLDITLAHLRNPSPYSPHGVSWMVLLVVGLWLGGVVIGWRTVRSMLLRL